MMVGPPFLKPILVKDIPVLFYGFYVFVEFYNILLYEGFFFALNSLKIYKIRIFKITYQKVNFCKAAWRRKFSKTLNFTNFGGKIFKIFLKKQVHKC